MDKGLTARQETSASFRHLTSLVASEQEQEMAADLSQAITRPLGVMRVRLFVRCRDQVRLSLLPSRPEPWEEEEEQ